VVLGRAPSAARERRAADAAHRVARDLGLDGEQVLFVDDVVPYAERGGWLRDADVAISTHLDHLETRFAFRTRILDFIWAGLPSVCTAGDDLSALVAQRGLGAAVPPGDASAAAEALDGLLAQGRDAAAERFAAVAAELAWPRVAEPLVRFATAAQRPPRLGAGGLPARPGVPARALAVRALRRVQRRLTR
jgi:glycosyltransferase involved in cell wall biosynthesis